MGVSGRQRRPLFAPQANGRKPVGPLAKTQQRPDTPIPALPKQFPQPRFVEDRDLEFLRFGQL